MKTQERSIKIAVVTGSTGAIGAALCQRLLDAGITVYAVARPGSHRIGALPKSGKLCVVPCDLKRIETLKEQIDSPADAFFHLAWNGTIGEGRSNTELQLQNVEGTLQAVHVAAAMGCKVFVGAGSQAEYGRVEGILQPHTPCFPETEYGAAKLCAGQMSRLECKKMGIDHIWSRILSVYGPHDGPLTMISGTIRALLRGEKPMLTTGEQLWDYLYVSDAAEALYRMAAYGHDGAVYPLGSGKVLPLRSYVELLRDAVDPAMGLGFGELPYSPQQVMRLQADIGALKHDTGFEPRISFEVGIRETIEWIRGIEQ